MNQFIYLKIKNKLNNNFDRFLKEINGQEGESPHPKGWGFC